MTFGRGSLPPVRPQTHDLSERRGGEGAFPVCWSPRGRYLARVGSMGIPSHPAHAAVHRGVDSSRHAGRRTGVDALDARGGTDPADRGRRTAGRRQVHAPWAPCWVPSPEVRRVGLAGADETFGWLPQASELGWPGTAQAVRGAPVRPDSTVLVAPGCPACPATWGERARIAVRAATIGYGLATTLNADSLEEVFDSLGRPPVSLTADELSFLGCVVILRRLDGSRRRVVAAHYVRPIVRDVHVHTQRLGPAILAARRLTRDTFEDFGWGSTPAGGIPRREAFGGRLPELGKSSDVAGFLEGVWRPPGSPGVDGVRSAPPSDIWRPHGTTNLDGAILALFGAECRAYRGSEPWRPFVPFLLFLHVMGAILAFGPTFAYSIMGAMAGREPQHANFSARQTEAIGNKMFPGLRGSVSGAI